MKLLALNALLLAALANASNVTESIRKFGRGRFLDRAIIKDESGIFFYREFVDDKLDLIRLVPRAKGQKRRLREINMKKGQEHRHLERAEVTSPKKGKYYSKFVTVEAAGIEGVEDPYFVFIDEKKKVKETRITTMEKGFASDKLGAFKPGAYTVSVYSGPYDATKTPVAEGGSFTYGPPNGANLIVRNSGTTDTIVEEAPWEGEGQVQGAVGRIYFSSYGVDYACTGTAIHDNKSGRSLILTAAHCVWDDIDENFGSNAIFIPNRDAVVMGEDQTGDDIHRMCSEDICGCWSLSGGVVHDKWPDTPWPARLAYDYGFWVVDDVGAHDGASCGSDALDIAVDELDFVVGVPLENEMIYNFGYSLEHNPDFRYCAEHVQVNQPTSGVDTAWMDSCGLTGGSSGGPWIGDFDPATGTGSVLSVNSWSYSARDGMGAPFIDESEARCLVNSAREVDIDFLEAQPEGEQGIYVSCYDRPCIPAEEAAGRKLRGRQLCAE